MNRFASPIAMLICSLGLAAALAPSAAIAQQADSSAAPTKIASANLQRIFTEVKETKDLETKFRAAQQKARTDAEERQKRLQSLQGQRDQFKAGTPEYERANQELVRTAIESQVSTQVAQQELVRDQKRSTKAVVEKIVAATQALAKEKGFALVLTQQVPPEPSEEMLERMTPEQLNQVLSSRNMLYVDPSVDLTTEIVARVDAAYASGN